MDGKMKNPERTVTRRKFIGQSVGAGVAMQFAPAVLSTSSNRVLGANERLRVGFIGVGNRGTQLLTEFMTFDDVEVAGLSDVYEPYLHRDRSRVEKRTLEQLGGRIPRMDEGLNKNVARYSDYRRLLEQKDIDAVVIATPDHWHAIQMIEACDSGKDVYVEKPLSATIHEGRRMIEVADRTGRVVQVGLQRRSCPVYSTIPEVISSGKIGKVSVARAYRISNMFPNGIGKAKPTDPPPTLNWDAWLGPRAWRDYQENIHPYRFRWWGDYSSQVGNWGVHYFDAIRWGLGAKAPISISSHGGRFVVDDDRTIPDTMEVTFELPGNKLLIFGQYEACGGEAIRDAEIEFHGSLGSILSNPSYDSSSGYRIVPSRGGQFQNPEPMIEAVDAPFPQRDSTNDHIRDFLDRVKDRKPCRCPLEEGHRSNSFALLANIAMETKSRIEWDPEKERITNSAAANELLHYEYRKPWKLG